MIEVRDSTSFYLAKVMLCHSVYTLMALIITLDYAVVYYCYPHLPNINLLQDGFIQDMVDKQVSFGHVNQIVRDWQRSPVSEIIAT